MNTVRLLVPIVAISAAVAIADELPAPVENTTDADAVRLDTVQISGQEEPLAEISTKKLLRVPGAGYDPLRAIGSLPGVTFTNGMGSEPAVRGSSPDDNAYYVDFLPVGYIFHSDSSSIISDNVLEDFRLETAVFSPQYNNATGAVIDATSRSPYYDRRQIIIDASLLKAGFFYEQPVNENQSFYIAGRQSLFQYYIENFLDDEDFEFTTVPEYYDYQGKYEIRLSDTEQVAFQILGSRDKAGLLFADDSDQVQQDAGLSGGLNFKALFNSQGILWDKLYSSGASHKIGLSHMEQTFAFKIGRDNQVDVKLNDFNLRSQFNVPVNFSHEIQWGVELNRSNVDYDGRFSGPPCDKFRPDCRRLADGTEELLGSGTIIVHEYDAHVADIWQVTSDWTLTPAVAVSWDDYTEETFVEPRLHSRWQFHDQWWFNAATGNHHILPDNFGQYIEPFGSEDLKQPTARHYELGLEYQLRSDLLWKTEIYYKELDNIIISRPAVDNYPDLTEAEYNALPRYTNDADGDTWGIEVFLNKNLTDRWYGWMSVAYARTFRRNNLTGENFRYEYDQPLIINTVANWKLNENWEVGFKWRLQSGQLVTPIIQPGIPPVYGELNSERLPVYHKLDVRADRTFRFASGWEMDFYGEILNVYGRENIIGYTYEEADSSKKVEVKDLPTIVSFGIKAKF